jgi:hypothetical protein
MGVAGWPLAGASVGVMGVGRRGPEEATAREIDGGPGKDGGPEVRTVAGHVG